MALVAPVEIVAACLVRYVPANGVPAHLEFVFNNGFWDTTPSWLTAGSPPYIINGTGDYTLYLVDLLDVGTVARQGGTVVTCRSTNITATPTVVFSTVQLTDAFGGDRAVRVRFYNDAGVLTHPECFSVKVMRNLLTVSPPGGPVPYWPF